MLPIIIDWTNPKAKIGLFFTVHDATYLPSFNCYHTPSDSEKINIYNMCLIMDNIRGFLGKPISTNCWIRPIKVNCPGFDPKTVKISDTDPQKAAKESALKALNYNLFIGSKALKSAHISGSACDFSVKGMTADEVRDAILPKMDEFKFRMENLKDSSWTHCDDLWVKNGHNYFIP